MNKLPWLEAHDYRFPPLDQALDEPNGLIAFGGDLSAKRLLEAYRCGIFPWYDDDQPILWWSPTPRAVLFPERIHISRSLAKRIKRGEYTITIDQAFEQVIQHCSGVFRSGQPGTWINDEMIDAYGELHRQGHAHSVESWYEGKLVGGLYGVAIGKIFFGESMFSLRTDASKVAFVALARQLQQWGFPLVDCQLANPHLSSLGAEEILREEFVSLLRQYTVLPGPENWCTRPL